MFERICSHGHHNAATAAFCNTCGEDIHAVALTAVATLAPAKKTFKDHLKEKQWLSWVIGFGPAFAMLIIAGFIAFVVTGIGSSLPENGNWIVFAVGTFGTLIGAPLFGALLIVAIGKNNKYWWIGALISFGIGFFAILISLIFDLTMLGNVLGWPGIVHFLTVTLLKRYSK